MRTEINIFTITFIILLIFIGVCSPILGYVEYRKLKKEVAESGNRKLKYYYDQIIWSWIPVIIILLLLPLSDMSLGDIGIRQIDIHVSSFSNWIIYPSIMLFLLYFLYNVYCIIVLKFSRITRIKSSERLPKGYSTFFPVTKREKKVWDVVAISAGITEELIYRGYLFCALLLIFPNLPVFVVLLFSTFIFGLGHIYQGKEVIKPTILGLIFGYYYIVFNSVLPIIMIHIAQDLVVRDLLDEENIKEKMLD